jgi:DNA-binding transcriptional ArsR family regulator
MARTWSFLTNHARALLLVAHNADARLRDIASAIGVTERTAYAIVADLAEAGYVVKERDGRRNRYHIQEHLPLPTTGGGELPTTGGGEPTIGELLSLLSDAELGPSPSSQM